MLFSIEWSWKLADNLVTTCSKPSTGTSTGLHPWKQTFQTQMSQAQWKSKMNCVVKCCNGNEHGKLFPEYFAIMVSLQMRGCWANHIHFELGSHMSILSSHAWRQRRSQKRRRTLSTNFQDLRLNTTQFCLAEQRTLFHSSTSMSVMHCSFQLFCCKFHFIG